MLTVTALTITIGAAPAAILPHAIPDGLVLIRNMAVQRSATFDAFPAAAGSAAFAPELERTWLDLEAANSRRLDLARRVVERLAADIAWLQGQEAAVGVPESELQPLREQVTRELRLSAAMYSLSGIGEILSELVGVGRASAQQRVADLRALIDDSRRIGVEDSGLSGPAAAADAAEAGIGTAPDAGVLWQLVERLSTPLAEVASLKADREAVLAAQQQALDFYNSLAGLRQRGYDALGAGRNDVAWAAFMGRGMFTTDAYVQLEAAAAALETNDRPALEAAVQKEQRIAAVVEQEFLQRLPPKVILVSLGGQELWAYDNGSLVVHTLVTTGRPELPTDVGLMRVYRKNSPWLMRSPWPPSSPYWYPDLTVRYAIWFHPAGEAIHDSWWRSWYGPSSNLGGYGSHGCIGLPYGPIDALYAWAPDNTPVVVIPGDGTAPAAQLARRTYNDPLMGAQFGI